MVALNTMLTDDGAALHVPAGHDGGIVQLVSIATGDCRFSSPPQRPSWARAPR